MVRRPVVVRQEGYRASERRVCRMAKGDADVSCAVGEQCAAIRQLVEEAAPGESHRHSGPPGGFGAGCIHRLLPRAQAIDTAGVVVVPSGMLVLALVQGELWRLLLFWLLLERVIGAIVQARGLIKHHGPWRSHGPHRLTRLSATRNISAAIWLKALMGALPHHGAHHAFPWIPSPRLPESTARIASMLASHQLPELPHAGSYWARLRLTGGCG